MIELIQGGTLRFGTDRREGRQVFQRIPLDRITGLVDHLVLIGFLEIIYNEPLARNTQFRFCDVFYRLENRPN